jgi:hypothetical protein
VELLGVNTRRTMIPSCSREELDSFNAELDKLCGEYCASCLVRLGSAASSLMNGALGIEQAHPGL